MRLYHRHRVLDFISWILPNHQSNLKYVCRFESTVTPNFKVLCKHWSGMNVASKKWYKRRRTVWVNEVSCDKTITTTTRLYVCEVICVARDRWNKQKQNDHFFVSHTRTGIWIGNTSHTKKHTQSQFCWYTGRNYSYSLRFAITVI